MRFCGGLPIFAANQYAKERRADSPKPQYDKPLDTRITRISTVSLPAYQTPLLLISRIRRPAPMKLERRKLIGLSISNDLLDMNRKLGLLPKCHNLAFFHPVLALRIELEIEGPDHLRKNETHLRIGKVLS